MKIPLTLLLWLVLWLLLPGAAIAQTNANQPVKDWSVETVVVTAEPPGPALWRITKGSSEVWILGLVEPLPAQLQWDSRGLRGLMDHARAVLLPPRGEVGMFEGLWFLIAHGDMLRLPEGQSLAAELPPALRARFLDAVGKAGHDPDRYASFKPAVAGFMLENDFLKQRDFTVREPLDTIRILAARRSVPVNLIATYPALDVVKQVSMLSPEGHRQCLTDSIDDLDTLAAHAAPAASAWAEGNVEGIEEHYSEARALDCLSQSASFGQLWERSVRDTVTAIDGALSRSGKTIVVINIGEFLRKNGVLERLKAQGLELEGPPVTGK